jgi:hypothetical protein
MPPLFDHSRHNEKARRRLGGVLHQRFSRGQRFRPVVPKPKGHVMGMGHGRHILGWRTGELTDPVQDRAKRWQNLLLLLVRDGKPGEAGKLLKVSRFEVHGREKLS